MENPNLMLDTHAVARSLTAADLHARPVGRPSRTALRLVVEQGDHVTSDQFKAGMHGEGESGPPGKRRPKGAPPPPTTCARMRGRSGETKADRRAAIREEEQP
ncbi:MAG: hypothetical protein OXG35_34165 [Acidobacteria bacterium]|nr:hypothetical protein [Acidobacteriota bacterium]